jgi:VanZ family protein
MQNSYPRNWRNPRAWQLALACYWLLLLVATHLPRETPLLPRERTDKIVHLAAFAALAMLSAATWQQTSGHLTPARLASIWIAITLYAALDEWTQPFVGRHGSIQDWLADGMGAALGLILFAWLRSTAD